MFTQQGILLLVISVVLCSFGLSNGTLYGCEDVWDCKQCDKIKRDGKCSSYQSVCYKTCSGCAPYADAPYQPCADVKQKGNCFNPIPYKSIVWAKVCEKTCCVLDTPPKFSAWSAWSPCSKSCHYGLKSRTRHCIGEGFGQTCDGPALETDKCNENVPCQGLVGWDKSSVEVDECAGTVTVTITRSRVTNCDAPIKINTQDGTATQPGDYDQINDLVITFLKGETSKSVTFKVKGDTAVEGAESFTATITADPLKLVVNQPKCTVNIKDQSAKIGFKPDKYMVSENDKSVKVTVHRFGNKDGKNTCSISSQDVTAASPADYQGIKDVPVVFAAGENSTEISINIVDDNVVESEEIFKLSLTCVKSPCTKVVPYEAIVVINSDDVDGKWTPWGQYGDCDKKCGGGSQSRSRTCTNPAPQGEGKQCVGESLSTQACNTHYCPIDGVYGSYSAYGDCSKTCGSGVQYKTRPCNNPKPQYGGKNCAGPAKASQACNIHPCPIDGVYGSYTAYGDCSKTCGSGVQYKTRPCNNPKPQYGGKNCAGPAKASQACNTHYCPIDGQWSVWGPWSKGSRSCGGATQYRTRTCTNPAPKYGGKNCVGNDRETRGCNKQPCPAKVGLKPVKQEVSESDGKVRVEIFRVGNSIGSNRVHISTVPKSAESPSDFVNIPETEVIFQPGQVSKVVLITINDDKVCEDDEVFELRLKSSDPGVVEVKPDTAFIKILDNDVCLRVKPTKKTVRESDGTVSLDVFREGNTRGETTATINTCDHQSAVAPGDFVALKDFVVKFAPKQKKVTFKIKINDDKLVEKIEDFCVTVTSSDQDVTEIKPNKAVVCITDNDVKISLMPKVIKVLEGKGHVNLKVLRYGNTKGSTKAVINTEDNTAEAGSDYKPRKNYVVPFGPGESVKHFKVFIKDDNIPEKLENFLVKLSSPDKDVTTINPDISTVHIIDDDAKIGFEKVKYYFHETAGTVKVVLVRSGAINVEHTVVVKSADGTAKAPADYGKVHKKITFKKNQVRVEFTITINNDNKEEGRETFKLKLSTRDGRVQLDPSVATVCIKDNDVDGKWGPWSSWSACGKPCGLSTKSRTRSCDNPAPQGEGKSCAGKAKETIGCYITKYCPINGGFSAWSKWSQCSSSCGGGHRTRTRTCTNPARQYGGRPCIGSLIELQDCNKKCCPVNGQWGSWYKWSACSMTCLSSVNAYGTRSRSRKCDNPAPSCGGAACAGGYVAAFQKKKCISYTPCSNAYEVAPMVYGNPYGDPAPTTEPPNPYEQQNPYQQPAYDDNE